MNRSRWRILSVVVARQRASVVTVSYLEDFILHDTGTEAALTHSRKSVQPAVRRRAGLEARLDHEIGVAVIRRAAVVQCRDDCPGHHDVAVVLQEDAGSVVGFEGEAHVHVPDTLAVGQNPIAAALQHATAKTRALEAAAGGGGNEAGSKGAGPNFHRGARVDGQREKRQKFHGCTLGGLRRSVEHGNDNATDARQRLWRGGHVAEVYSMNGTRRHALSLFVAGLILLIGSSQAQFAYVTNGGGSNNVSAYRMGANGDLTPVPGSPFAAGSLPSSIAVEPAGRFAYVVNEGGDDISAYSIDKSGGLTPIPGSPFSTRTDPHEVVVDPTGQFAYVVNAATNDISAYHIDAKGTLTAVQGSPFPAGSFPRSVAVDPNGKFVYVANQVSNNVSVYHLGKDGVLKPVPGSPFGAGIGPFSVAATPSFAYVVNEGDGNVSAYEILESGSLAPIAGSPFAAGNDPVDVAVHPSGRFAYVANQVSHDVSAFQILENGTLRPIPGSPFKAGVESASVAPDPTGKFLYVPSKFSHKLWVFRIASDGTLTPLAGSPFPTGAGPNSTAFTPPLDKSGN